MRELREQFRAARMRDEMAARVRDEMGLRPRRCGECGLVVGACLCGGEYASSTNTRRRRNRARWSEWDRDRDRGRYEVSDVEFEGRAPPRQRRGSVRWVDEVGWD